jgi:16S rRNA (adenine1518-N6/adenine1519-N6)-dimethyltransferase
VVEVGPGLGSLTVALARAGADVLAVEVDPALAAALEEVARDMTVRVVVADAMRLDWDSELGGREGWLMVSNLPYNVATPLVLGMLERGLPIERYVVMVQREVGERLAAGPGDEGYGGSSVRVAYHATARLLRRVPASVFWPQPAVESVLVELVPRSTPPVDVDRDRLFRVVEEAFAQRRKTMRNALVRLGLDPGGAAALLPGCGIASDARAEQLSLHDFACIAGALP